MKELKQLAVEMLEWCEAKGLDPRESCTVMGMCLSGFFGSPETLENFVDILRRSTMERFAKQRRKQ